MDLRRLPSPDDLLILLTVARLGRFNAVAETLGTTHTTISRRILALDKQLGGRTLERSPHGWELTDLGQQAVAAAEAIEGTLGALTNRIAHVRGRALRPGPDQHPGRLRRRIRRPGAGPAAAGPSAAQRRDAQRHPQGQPEPVRRGPGGGGGQPGRQQCAGHLPVQLLPPAVRQPAVRPRPRPAGDARRRPAARLCLLRGVGAAGRRTGPPLHAASRAALQLPGHQHLRPAGGRPAGRRDRPAAELPGGRRPGFPARAAGRLPAAASDLGGGTPGVAALGPRAGRARSGPDRDFRAARRSWPAEPSLAGWAAATANSPAPALRGPGCCWFS